MSRDSKQSQSEKFNPQDLWNEISIARSGIDALLKQGEQTGDLQLVNAAIEELKLKTSNYERLLEEMQAPLKGMLGQNFLGTAEWLKGFGVKVGRPPPIPESITPELLNSNCPLHPGEKIKDTHILMLTPKTVDGKAFSALKLEELCATRQGSGRRLIYALEGYWNEWKKAAWANASPSESEWVLIPKSDPDQKTVPWDKHFRWKNIDEQEEVYKHYAAEYREAKALEVMTMAVLNDLVNGEPRILEGWNYLRCVEPSASGDRVCVGRFHEDGLGVADGAYDNGFNDTGRALARKL
jgi:hypothetical protein